MVQTNEPTARAPIQFGENLRITVAANQGGRRYMEDRCVVHTERVENGTLQWTFVGVFDGHGGEHASEYVRRHLLMNITRNHKFESTSDEDILESIRQGFLMTHEQMRHVYEEWPYTASGYPSTAGTTVSCVFIRNGKLYTGHVGDSAIFLGTVENGDLHSRPLTTDHKPESAHEQLRIAKAGGETAVKSGVTRVVWKRQSRINHYCQTSTSSSSSDSSPNSSPLMETIPFLSVARSLGDLWSYNQNTNMFVVSPEPDLGVHRLTGNDFCLVLASDGMTNVLTGEQAISIVFKEEELVEIHDEINRNHSRCVLRTALQKWRSLRADNVTVATVIFDIDPLSYTENEMLMKVGKYVNASQVLTDRPDAMLKVSKTDNVLLSTQRTPIIYNGSKDLNFCRVLYRGPGFRTHEEELLEERRNIMSKFADGAIAIAGGPIDSKRGGGTTTSGIIQETRVNIVHEEEEEKIDYDDDDEDGDDEEEKEDEDGPFDPSAEIDLSLRFTEKTVTVIQSPNRPPRPHAPRPVFIDDSIIEEGEGSEEGVGVQSTSSTTSTSTTSITPSRTPPGQTVRRVKAEAVRRLRTPRITASSEVMTPSSESSTLTPDRRITRSASKLAANTPIYSPNNPRTPFKTPTFSPRGDGASIIGVNTNLTPDAILVTPRRSSRLLNSSSGGVTPSSAKLTMSRKRARTMEMPTGVTPVVASLSLQDHHHHSSQAPPPPPPPTPSSHSAPPTPKKAEKSLKASKWSLSKLDEKKRQKMMDGIQRVSEVADEDDDEDVVRGGEPPSKIRRFYGYMRKMFWGK